ncbi:siderophore-interacting protein [Celeribacter sp. ULVN23_4]
MSDLFQAEVLECYRLSPSLMRVVLGRADLADFQSSGHPDEWVRLSFPEAPKVPRRKRPDELVAPTRPYTVRHWDAERARMTVDFVRHAEGVATTWAASARPGDRILLSRPAGKFAPVEGTEWIALIADATGLPAVGRILEELPDHMRVIAHLDVPEQEDRLLPRARSGLSVTWHQGATLPQMAGANDWPDMGTGYVWIAGEAGQVRAARDHFFDRHGLPSERMTAIGYWIEGQSRG